MKPIRLIGLTLFSLALVGCTAGSSDFAASADPAGFFSGIWHGMIAFIALIIHIFNADVLVYEVNNSGGWYDFGFLLGVICIYGGGSHATYKSKAEKKREQQWSQTMSEVEQSIMVKLKNWADSEPAVDPENEPDWDEIGAKVQAKIKRLLHQWSDDSKNK